LVHPGDGADSVSGVCPLCRTPVTMSRLEHSPAVEGEVIRAVGVRVYGSRYSQSVDEKVDALLDCQEALVRECVKPPSESAMAGESALFGARVGVVGAALAGVPGAVAGLGVALGMWGAKKLETSSKLEDPRRFGMIRVDQCLVAGALLQREEGEVSPKGPADQLLTHGDGERVSTHRFTVINCTQAEVFFEASFLPLGETVGGKYTVPPATAHIDDEVPALSCLQRGVAQSVLHMAGEGERVFSASEGLGFGEAYETGLPGKAYGWAVIRAYQKWGVCRKLCGMTFSLGKPHSIVILLLQTDPALSPTRSPTPVASPWAQPSDASWFPRWILSSAGGGGVFKIKVTNPLTSGVHIELRVPSGLSYSTYTAGPGEDVVISSDGPRVTAQLLQAVVKGEWKEVGIYSLRVESAPYVVDKSRVFQKTDV
jgi:hypothetical protein